MILVGEERGQRNGRSDWIMDGGGAECWTVHKRASEKAERVDLIKA